jgi:hypothetical protein
MQRFLYPAIGQDIQKWRLSELYTECLLQRIIEDGVAGRVAKVSKHHRILFREGRGVGSRRRRTRTPVEATGDQHSHQYHNCGNNYFPQPPSANLRNIDDFRGAR